MKMLQNTTSYVHNVVNHYNIKITTIIAEMLNKKVKYESMSKLTTENLPYIH